ncbi:MAG: arylsulfatase [Opitutus sp.]
MRSFLVIVALSLAATLMGQASKPNFIFILSDDLGYGELGSQGQKLIATPHLDRMAAEGMSFTQFYAGSTVCAPSRSVLMTGQHTGHTRVRGNAGGRGGAQMLAADDVTVARVLKQAGYATSLVGKWGLGVVDDDGEPRRHGFDEYFGFLSQTHAHNHFPNFLWRNGQKEPLPNDLVPVGTGEGVGYASKRVAYAGDLFAEEAVEFVERNRDRPFFLYLALTSPHANNERSRELGEGNEVPDFGRYATRTWNASQKNHAAMITRFDRDIGELFTHLKRLDVDERTLVIFTSDNGAHREGGPDYDPEFFNASGPLRGIKRDLTEGGIRVPFIARWPGRIKAGTVSSHPSYFGDIMATYAELAGAKLPPNLDSISLVPTLLGGGNQRQHPYLYWEFYENGVSQAVLLEGHWKGIRPKSATAPIELYELGKDIGETTDVAAANPAVVARIAEIMQTAHVPNEHWKIPGLSDAPRR